MKEKDDDRRPDRLDYIEARLKRLEQQLDLGPLELKQFLAEWEAKKLVEG
jgi:hypothetical protein